MKRRTYAVESAEQVIEVCTREGELVEEIAFPVREVQNGVQFRRVPEVKEESPWANAT